MNKKYVIEIKPEYEDSFKGVMLLGAKDGNLFVDTLAVDDLEELNSDYINEHFSDLQDTAYQKGLAEGREQMPCDTCAYRHNNLLCADCKWTYGSRYKVDSIGVGDEVKSLSDSGVEIEGLLPWVVTTVDQGDYCQGIDSKGEVHATKKVRACKTGRHFDIASILEDMRND